MCASACPTAIAHPRSVNDCEQPMQKRNSAKLLILLNVFPLQGKHAPLHPTRSARASLH